MTPTEGSKTLFLCAALAVASGCVTPPSPSPSPSTPGASTSCTVLASGGAGVDSLVVVTPFSIDATRVVRAENAAERFAFAQSYETLIDVDCTGRAYAGLAKLWTTDETKTRVTLALRDDARFWNGDPVLARDVIAAWRTTGASESEAGRLARRLAEATTIVDDHTLIVSLSDTALRILADRALFVYRGAPGSTWPEGSGPYRAGEPTAGVVALVPARATPAPRLVIRSRPGADARDAIDAGADLLLFADLTAVRYAAARSDLAAVPLPWTRTYVLAGRNVATEWGLAAGDSAAPFRASLARDAVRAEARGADPIGWWNDAGCQQRDSAGGSRSTAGRRRVVYRADDHIARAIVERLVALERRATAAPLAAAEFADALRAGGESAYVVSVPHVSLAPCRDLAALLASAPWVGTGGSSSGVVLPLVDIRERAILNRARVSVVIDWDGTLRMTPNQP
jgi:hypothetical protein